LFKLIWTRRIDNWKRRIAVGIGSLLVTPAGDFIGTNTASGGDFTNPAVRSVNDNTSGLNDNVWLTNTGVYTSGGATNSLFVFSLGTLIRTFRTV